MKSMKYLIAAITISGLSGLVSPLEVLAQPAGTELTATKQTGTEQIGRSPVEVGNSIVDNIVDRYWGWRYQKTCTYYGALIFADQTGNPDITRRIEEGYSLYDSGKRKPHRGHVDHNLFGIWPLELYRQTGNERYLEMGLDLADHEYAEVREDGLTSFTRFWVDDMYMVTSLQVQAYKATGDSKYLDRAAEFIKAYLDALQRENGLFYHRPDVPFFWGRGNGWAVAGMTELLLVLPEDHKHHAAILDGFQRMMKTLAEYQGPNGMWHQLIDDHESFAESSSTGMFLYGLISGVDNAWLPEEEFKPVIENGWAVLSTDYVNDKGEAMKVCIGTNAKPRRGNYVHRPRTNGNFHGQAAVLWAATAMHRYQND